MRERGCLRATLAHPAGELHDALLVLALGAELVSGEEPRGGLAAATGLDVGGLLAGLPAAGEHHGALDCRALLVVDVLGIAEAQRLQILAGEPNLAVGAVERDGQAAVFVDVCDLAAGAVLDTGLSRRPVLGGERDQITFAQPVVQVRERNLAGAEFAARDAEVLSAGVEPVDLLVGGVGDQRDLANVVVFGERDPALHGASPASSRVSMK